MTTTTTRPAPRPATHAGAPARPGRLRWLDAVRAIALLVVVAGHTLQAVVHLPAGGELSLVALLDQTPTWTHWLTWPLQVMPAFFAVGAYAAAASLADQPVTDTAAWGRWTGRRLRRLVVPTLPLLAVWAATAALLAGRVEADLLQVATAAALVPLWFLAVYVVVQALVPVWIALLAQHRWWVLLAGSVVTAAMVDAAHLAGVPAVGFVNFVAVWSIPTLLGVAAQRGLIGPRDLAVLAALAVTGAAVLLATAGYATPVVGLTGAERGNNSPPTLLLACHATLYTAVVFALAPRAERWLGATARRRQAITTAAAWSMPLYLWHMTGMVALIALVLTVEVPVLSGLVAVEPMTGAWWLLRPVWIAAVLLPTLALLLLTRRPTTALVGRSSAHPLPSPCRAAGAMAGVSAGIGAVVLGGFGSAFVPGWLILGALALLHPPRRG